MTAELRAAKAARQAEREKRKKLAWYQLDGDPRQRPFALRLRKDCAGGGFASVDVVKEVTECGSCNRPVRVYYKGFSSQALKRHIIVYHDDFKKVPLAVLDLDIHAFLIADLRLSKVPGAVCSESRSEQTHQRAAQRQPFIAHCGRGLFFDGLYFCGP